MIIQVLTALFAMSTVACAQEDLLSACTTPLTEPVAISADFDADPETRYTLQKDRWMMRQGVTTHVTIEFEVTITSVRHDDVVEINWNQRITKMPPELSDPNNPMTRLSSIWSEYDVVTTLKDGIVGDVKNLDALTANAERILEEVEGMLRDVMPEQQVKAIVDNARQTLEPEIMQASLLADLRRLLVPYGYTIDPREPIRWQEPVILPIGGTMIDADMTLSGIGFDDEGHIGLRQQRLIDEALVRAALEKTLAEIAESVGRPLPPEFEMPTLEMTYQADYLQDPASPWPVAATIDDASSAAGDQSRRERWQWRRID